MKNTENNITISDVLNTLKTTNLVSEFGHNCDFLKQSLILFHNLTAKGIVTSNEEKQEIFNVLNRVEQIIKTTIPMEEVK